ncbi:hypothetical protein [Paraburkholderia sp. MM5477-R1]|uniref:hypothetical protein n=1 Tax=Paraburkholderia sp. MM5477-R1 TaxID=2991062 RepID=UPI003D1A677F
MSEGLIGAKLVSLLVRLCLLSVILAAPVYLALANFATFEPYLFPLHAIQAGERQVTPNVIIGPYPSEARLMELRRSGVRVVISLLNQDLVYEKPLIARENELASAFDMEELNAPMDSSEPANSKLNAAALAKVRAFVRSHPNTRVYVHCYLGKHRVQQVANMLVPQ